MNGRRDIEDYRQQRRADDVDMIFEGIRWLAQIATPLLLALILWKVW